MAGCCCVRRDKNFENCEKMEDIDHMYNIKYADI